MIVIINGKNHEVKGEEITYEDVVEAAYPGRNGVSFLVSYSYRGKNKGGTLAPGGRAELEQGMIFHCHRDN